MPKPALVKIAREAIEAMAAGTLSEGAAKDWCKAKLW